MFLRISQGASRLQEVLADRWAAFTYGGRSFERGLRHVIERSVRFDAFANAALHEVIQKKEPLANLYAYRPSLLDTSSVDHDVDAALTAEASPYDSHPSPSDRIRWARALGTGHAESPDDEQEVWSLFGDRDELERRLTAQVRADVHAAHDIRIPETAEAAAW